MHEAAVGKHVLLVLWARIHGLCCDIPIRNSFCSCWSSDITISTGACRRCIISHWWTATVNSIFINDHSFSSDYPPLFPLASAFILYQSYLTSNLALITIVYLCYLPSVAYVASLSVTQTEVLMYLINDLFTSHKHYRNLLLSTAWLLRLAMHRPSRC